MATDKRDRQREARLVKMEEEARTSKRHQRGRQVRGLVIILVLVVLAALAVSIFAGDDDEDVASEDTATSTTVDPAQYSNPDLAAEVLGRDMPEPKGASIDLAKDALEVETLIDGEGEALKAGDTLVAHYVGVLPSDASFDDSWSQGEPFETTIPGQVIDGWNEGLIGVKIGERRQLTIGSDKAYGDAGNQTIPPDTPLVFVIDVVDVAPAGDAAPTTAAPAG